MENSRDLHRVPEARLKHSHSLIRKSLHASLCLLLLAHTGCGDDLPPGLEPGEEMRQFVMGISSYARSGHPGFIVIPQNGIELVSTDGDEGGALHSLYLAAIDAHGQEDLFYGYDRDDRATPAEETGYLRSFLDRSMAEGNTILVTDYCSTPSHMDDSYVLNRDAGYVSFAASSRELDVIPSHPQPIHAENEDVVTGMGEVRNFLYLINPDRYPSKEEFIGAVTATNYDLLIMDLFSVNNQAFTPEETALLKQKANGGERLVIAYMSIGEAEDYRYYWQASWEKDPPSWMDGENPAWEGNYKVRYWEADWQDIIYGSAGSYLDRILDAGFDGVYLDIIDAFEYYE